VKAEQKLRKASENMRFSALIPVKDDQQLANMGFFFAKKTFNEINIGKKGIGQMKHLEAMHLQLRLNPDFAEKVFPGVNLPNIVSEHGLYSLERQLEATPAYQIFLKTIWHDYQQLRQDKIVAKAMLRRCAEQGSHMKTFL
jgi:hypothetical protein